MDLNTPFDYCVSDNSRETADVGFMYFSPEEIRRVSVEEINDISFFGEFAEQLDRGLHSPALGPLKLNSSQGGPSLCKTCGLDRDCPGHMGHIELACTLYNPFLLSTLGKLLSKTCLTCHKFVSSDGKAQATVEALSRTPQGELAKMESVKNLGKKRSALESVDQKESSSSKRILVQEISEEFGERWRVECVEDKSLAQEMACASELARCCSAANAEAQPAGGDKGHPQMVPGRSKAAPKCEVAAATLSFRALLSEFWKDLPLKCERCGRKPAKWRRQGFSSFFLRQAEDKEDHLALPVKVRDIMRSVWKKEASLLWWLLPGARERGAEIFFLDNILVPPNNFRPCLPPEGKDSGPSLDKQTHHLACVLAANAELRRWIRRDATTEGEEAVAAERSGDAVALQFARAAKSLEDAVEQLQLSVNNLMDSTKCGKNAKLAVSGIRQLLEKKAGLFRMKIMGKRVNFAARSVISPDPNIESCEIGIPMMVANELSYPEVAANHNADMLRKLVERGPKYPGAKEVHIPRPNGSKQVVNLKIVTKEKREALAKQLITDIETGQPPMTVFRQLRDGDPLLVNRQPTLHKPGIMAHVAKVMKKEKTIRLHYVNCNTYNADFDGDEMNLHAPQDPIGRMEALLIARADGQYLVPTSGKPLRGLIQDSCIAGAMLSKRDSFFSRQEVCLLLYHGLRAAVDVGEVRGDFGRGSRPWVMGDLRPHLQRLRLRLDEPCMLRPQRLWSGKQIFSMLLKNLVELRCNDKRRHELGHVNLESGSKTPGDMWNGKLDGNKEESSVLVQGTDLLRGVLDKAQFGASSFGLTHIIHELLGPHMVGQWLASLARMLTLSLQLRGFTCAFSDLFLTDQTEETRTQLIRQSRKTTKTAVEGWLAKNKRHEFADGRATPQMVADAASQLMPKKKRAQEYEGTVIGKMKENWSDLINMCIPVGQKVPFPRNCFSAMVQTGAKGSKVNQSQVSCCLGQQELEGRLPPLMCTFRSLPCFAPFDMASRTRGYIADRFLSGIRPQEFFFHCMAGREGLVDTAVKTSRSGYLQRCLVKHLESLKVGYDLTVRDADGTVVQFLYGEDGVDVTKSSYLFNFKGLHPNLKSLEAASEQDLQKLQHLGATGKANFGTASSYLAACQSLEQGQSKKAAELLQALLEKDRSLDKASRCYLERRLSEVRAGQKPVRLDPVSSLMSPGHFFGATSERHHVELRKHTEALQAKGEMSPKEAESFAKCTRLRFMRSLAAPGEAVGVIAAQSMGEPSTQMTLNTFHLAGHGGANVTLGIPRLREIVQTASKTCSTPLMQVKVLHDEQGNKSLDARLACAQRMKARFRRLKLMDCLQRLVVHEEVRMIGQEVTWVYHCRFMFFDLEKIQAQVPHATRERLESFMRVSVIMKLKRQLTRVINSRKGAASSVKPPAGGEEGEAASGQRNEEGGGGGGEGEEPAQEAAQAPAKRPRRGARGEEDKAQNQEAMDAAEEAEDPQAEMSDQGSSGMYSETDEEKAHEVPAESDAEGEGEEGVGETQAPGGAHKVAGMVGGIGAEEDAFGPPDPEWDEQAGDEDEDGAKSKLADPQSKTSTSSGKQSKAKAGKKAASSAGYLASQQLAQALTTNQLVWSSKLEGNEMAVIVTHKSSQCPHSIFVGEVLHKICKHAQLQDPACRGVKRVHVKQENGEVSLECEGINLYALQVLGDAVDRERVYTNDIQKVLRTFGIEAARASVVKEIRAVFGHYGIEVDHRHLSLIADYMSQTGTLRAFNRIGMATQPSSPLQQISFECSMHFINAACQGGLVDPVMSPASAICLGQLPKIGTGMVSLMVDLNPPLPTWRRKREFTF